MHRFSARTLTVVSLAGLLAAGSLPAHAKSSRPKQHRGKKAVGEIVSFDAATMALVVDLPGDEDFTGAVDPDVRVKLDHRGWAKKGSSHKGNPTEGSLDDLLPGTAVLRMKVEDDLVTKIRVRPTGEESPLPDAGDEGDDEDALPGDDDPSDDALEGDDADEGSVDDDSGDDATDDTDGEDADSSDDDDLGDPEDAVPPLPVPQP